MAYPCCLGNVPVSFHVYLLVVVSGTCTLTTHTHTGMIVIPTIIPQLPFGSNHLGISEETTIALLCLLMELFIESVENAR